MTHLGDSTFQAHRGNDVFAHGLPYPQVHSAYLFTVTLKTSTMTAAMPEPQRPEQDPARNELPDT